MVRDAVRRWTSTPVGVVQRPAGSSLLSMGRSHSEPLLVQYSADGHVSIGDYSSINEQAEFLLGEHHRVEWVSSFPFRTLGLAPEVPGAPSDAYSAGPTVVGSDVVIGHQALIFSGVTIGHGAVVAARAVVTRDVEPYSVVAGIPAHHIRWRFDAPTREALLRIAWWTWPHERVIASVPELMDVAAFVAKYDVPGA